MTALYSILCSPSKVFSPSVDFTHMLDIEQKETNVQTKLINKQKLIAIDNRMVVTKEERWLGGDTKSVKAVKYMVKEM